MVDLVPLESVLSQGTNCSSALAEEITYFVANPLTLAGFSSTKNSCCLVQLVKISFTCSFFSICGHLVDSGPLVSSTSFLYLPSLDNLA